MSQVSEKTEKSEKVSYTSLFLTIVFCVLVIIYIIIAYFMNWPPFPASSIWNPMTQSWVTYNSAFPNAQYTALKRDPYNNFCMGNCFAGPSENPSLIIQEKYPAPPSTT